MKKITLFVKFKEDNSIDYVSDTVLISKDDSDRVYIVDGQAEALKEILVSNQIIDKDSEVITQNDFDEALKLGCVNIVDMDKLDQDFYKNIMTDLDHTELTPEEQKEINNSITYIESISNEKEESMNNKNLSDENSIDEELDEDYDSEIDEEEINNKKFGIGAVGLAAAAGATIAGAAGYAIGNKMFSNKVETQMKVNQSKQLDEKLEKERLKESLDEINNAYENETVNNEERSEYSILDFDMSNASQIQKEFLNSTAALITKFHEQTHKENNFRLTEDNEHYLDLTLDEAISLNIMLNDYSEEEITEIFGYKFMSLEKIKTSIKSSYNKLILYYMNAKEKSYISDIIKDEEKKKIFEDIEEKVLRFNNASSLNLDDIYNDEIYKKITSSNFEDFKSYIQIIPFMGVIMKNSNLEENSKIITNNQEKLESIINDKAIIIDAKITISNIKYLKKYTMILLNSLKDKDDEVLKMTRNLEETYKNIYGIDIKNYISEEEIKKIVSDFYELTLIDKKMGLTLNKVEDKINLSKLDGIYELTDQKTVNKLIDIRKDKKLKKSKRLIRIN